MGHAAAVCPAPHRRPDDHLELCGVASVGSVELVVARRNGLPREFTCGGHPATLSGGFASENEFALRKQESHQCRLSPQMSPVCGKRPLSRWKISPALQVEQPLDERFAVFCHQFHLVHAVAGRHGFFGVGLRHADFCAAHRAFVSEVDSAEFTLRGRPRERSSQPSEHREADSQHDVDEPNGNRDPNDAHGFQGTWPPGQMTHRWASEPSSRRKLCHFLKPLPFRRR
jgi:hypothetical protein